MRNINRAASESCPNLIQIENTPALETERLILRKFNEADVPDMLPLYSDEEVNRFLPWFPMETLQAVKSYLRETILPDYQKAAAYRYAIALKTNNRIIGYVSIGGLGQSNDLGYGLRKEFWGKGIVTEAARAVCVRCKADGLPFLTATHDIYNPGSGAVMQKLGMTYRYSYEELCRPKNNRVTFRMYQIDFNPATPTYAAYQKRYPFFVEQIPSRAISPY